MCRFLSGTFAALAIGAVASAQHVTVVPLSTGAANSNYAVAPQADGVTFVGGQEAENHFLIVLDGDLNSASQLTIGPNGARLIRGQDGPFVLAAPLIQLRDDEYSFSFVAVTEVIKGTAAEAAASQQWATGNSAWSTARFGWGWQDALGEWMAANVLIPAVGVENLANASDTVLVIGTVGTVAAVVGTGFVVVEVGLGVGTLGGAATGGGGVAVGGSAVATEAEAVTALGGFASVGSSIGMGVGAEAAIIRTATITVTEIQQAGITLRVARWWLQFYQNAVATGRGGAAAEARVQLWARIVQLLGG